MADRAELAHSVALHHPATQPPGDSVAEIGVQWGLLGDPDGLQLTLTTLVGSGFLTSDSTEFAMADVGAGFTWSAAESIQLYANVAMTARHRKILTYGPAAYAGVRYLFD